MRWNCPDCVLIPPPAHGVRGQVGGRWRGDVFGRLVAPLGVEYVVLARDLRELPDYGWVRRQPDLALVLDTATMAVYRVEARGTGRVVARRSATYEQTLQWAAAGSWAPRRSRPREVSTRGRSQAAGSLRKLSATQWQVEAEAPDGW